MHYDNIHIHAHSVSSLSYEINYYNLQVKDIKEKYYHFYWLVIIMDDIF